MLRAVALALLLTSTAAAPLPDFPPLEGRGLQDCLAGVTDVCRVRRGLNPETARARLAGKPVAWWAEGDTFTVVTQQQEAPDGVSLCCAIQGPLAQLPGTNFWTLTVRSPHIPEAILDVNVEPGPPVSLKPGGDWHGPRAPALLTRTARLSGAVRPEEIKSAALGETRTLSIYTPPGFSPAEGLRVAYVADGDSVYDYAQQIEPAIVAGRLPRLLLVGAPSGAGTLRNEEYLLKRKNGGFQRYEAFLLREVMPLVESRYGASRAASGRVLVGFSNGGDWALDMALLHPELFGNAVVLSPTGASAPEIDKPGGPRLYFGVGLFEPKQLHFATELHRRAAAASKATRLKTFPSGHSPLTWRELMPEGLVWVFGRTA